MNPISTAGAGLISASNRFDQAALSAVSATTPGSTTDPAAAAADLSEAKASFQAQAKVLKAANDMFQSTLDILV